MKTYKKWTDLWLKYDPKKKCDNCIFCQSVVIRGFDSRTPIMKNALKELESGVFGMLRVTPALTPETAKPLQGILIMRAEAREQESGKLGSEGYRLRAKGQLLSLEAQTETGVLYGIFHILREISLEKPLKELHLLCKPDIPLRMLNKWDNLDGSIERGYSGRSFFFRDNQFLWDGRAKDYARLAASVGINGIVINNVNVLGAATRLITSEYYEQVARLAEIFSSYGIRLFLSINFAAPLELDGPGSADPLNEQVIAWWKTKIAEIFSAIPNLGGFLVKADSEGRPGPFTYGRTQADGANMLARLTEPYGGLIIWRCFVYNCTQDWRDRKTDRAKAGYDNFIGTDGDYRHNVILQIKNGPMDFQTREPVSPLLGGMQKTNQMLEVQLAQEYTGQQIDVFYLIPLFKEVLEFRIGHHKREKETSHDEIVDDRIVDVISGRTFQNPYGGISAVCNTGDDENWTGNDLAAANLYGYGRLSWSASLTPSQIAEEWIRMTLSGDAAVLKTVSEILLTSRETYEKYTSPLGIGWMVTPHTHYGPSIDGYEYSRWGTYHRADHLGMGVDRTNAGTGYTQQYYDTNAAVFDDINTCPEELLLFFHRVPYSYVLKSGKTLIQHIYDSHFEGVEEVVAMIAKWNQLKGKLPSKTFLLVEERLRRQLENAREWRDQVNSYFYRKSGIEDQKGRKIY